jgi:tetratricopeptide (TPR) repeat protein
MPAAIRFTLALSLLAAGFASAQDDPATGIPPLLKTGDAAYLKGDYEAAFPLFARAWELVQQAPKDDPLRYDILKRLTSVRAAAGEFADADAWLQQAITWRENTLGQKDPKIAADLWISAALWRGMKDFDRALLIFQRVRAMHVAAFTFNSTQVADDFSRIAQIYMDQKKPEEAINSLNVALEIRTKLAGPLDLSLVPDLDRLGELHTAARDYEKSEDVFRHVLAIRETLYGKVHADLISTVDGLAYAVFGQKKYDVAEPIYLRLISLWETSVGMDHPMVAVALDKVAVFYAEQKKLDQMRDALVRSTAIRAHFLASGISQQATAELIAGRVEQAKAFYQRGLMVLDPPNPINQELRAQFETMLKDYGKAGPNKKGTQPKKQ